MQKKKIVLVEPLKSPKVIEIDHELKIMQSVVGGDIACTYPWPDLAGLIYADDGIALGYPLNRMLKDEDGKVYDTFQCFPILLIKRNIVSQFIESRFIIVLIHVSSGSFIIAFKI